MIRLPLCMLFLLFGCAHNDPPEVTRVLFLGDSITRQGAEEGGYIMMMNDSLKNSSIELIGKGEDGDKVTDLLERVDDDVIAEKPSLVVILIGINDVWHEALGIGGTPKAKYEEGLRHLVEMIQKSGARVVLCTPTVIGEKTGGANPLDGMLDEYADISRRVARSTGATLCDVHQVFRDHLEKNNPDQKRLGILTYDEVHLSTMGNELLASSLLACLRKIPY